MPVGESLLKKRLRQHFCILYNGGCSQALKNGRTDDNMFHARKQGDIEEVCDGLLV
jgi:hypothetical protein